MSHDYSSEITRKRIARWFVTAQPIATNPTWTERRLAIDFGEHTYIVNNGQIYMCAHCGNYDPEWSATEVLAYFNDKYGIKPREIEITCTVAVVED